MRTHLRTFVAFALLITLCAHAADKSGVSPTKISLPKGPGSIEGLGESFQPTLNTGTAKYAIPLNLPPGTAGHAPKMVLSYDGGGANGPVGFGWSLPMSSIQRRSDKGIPLYGDTSILSRSDIFINDMREELVPLTNGDWPCKNEGAFIRYRQTGESWEATSPDGTQMLFGSSPESRLQNALGPSPQVFSWLVDRGTDTHGNTITYRYIRFPGDQNTNQVYLADVSYGPGNPPWTDFHFAHFIYEDRRDWFEDCRPGFPVRTGKRLKSIVIGTQGPTLPNHLQGDFNNDGIPDHLVRRYDLEYLNYSGVDSHWSLLARVTVIGSDGQTSLPPAVFDYHVCNPPDELAISSEILGGEEEPPTVMDSELVDFNDLNGDGLPDILRTELGGGRHFAYLNQGERGPSSDRKIKWSAPTEMDASSGDAFNFNLSSTSTHLADMDGDGRSDLVHRVSAERVFYFPNLGRGTNTAWGERLSLSIENEAPPSPFGDKNVRTGDLDFDKRTDIIESVQTGGGFDYRVWFCLAERKYSYSVTIPQDNGFDFANPAVQIADLNGDRVPDIAQITLTTVELTSGFGYGRFGPLQNIPIPGESLEPELRSRAKLQDLNGDGLADLVIDRTADGSLWYWLNLGNATFSSRKRISGMPARISSQAATRWADINGNGTADLIYADSQADIAGLPRLQSVDLGQVINCGANPNALIRIENSIGRITLISYKPSTEFSLADMVAGTPWPDPMPFPVQVVSAITNLDSLGNAYVTQFRYHDGYYDPEEKQFRGFARVEQIDLGDSSAPTLVTRSYFDTGRGFEAMKGKLLRLTTEQEDGRVFSDQTTAWQLPPRTLQVGTNGTAVSFAHPISSTNIIKELGQGIERRLETETDYDDYGNRTRDANYGIVANGDRSAFDDERIISTEYAINTNSWILRTPKRTEIMDENGIVLSRSVFFYDDESFLGTNWGTVTIGNLTMKREWIWAATNNAYITTARTKYDRFGNPIKLLDPLAAAQGGSVNLNKGHVRELDYDSRFQSYPITEIIHLGEGKEPLIFQAAYDEGFGAVTRSTDFNSNSTTYGYDAFGRLTRIVKPGDSEDYPTVEYEYVLSSHFPRALAGGGKAAGIVNFIETRQRDKADVQTTKADMYFRSRHFVDGLGRCLMTKTEAEPASTGGLPRVSVSGAVLFNARQKPFRAVNPFFTLRTGGLEELLAYEDISAPGWEGQFQNEGALVPLDLADAHSIRTDYDATLRATKVTNPDRTFRRTVYEPLATRSFDENDTDPSSPHSNTPMVHYKDGLERLVKVDEVVRLNDDGSPGPLTTWTTRYRYDLNDQLRFITDSQNNVKEFCYDGLKRKTFMNDPDRGHMTWIYDDADNLTESIDAKSQRITYTYDGANRILSEDYHDGLLPQYVPSSPITPTNRPDVAYFYDAPLPDLDHGDTTTGTSHNTKGMLAYVWDLSGEEHTSYDLRGRIEYTVKRIPDPIFDPQGAGTTNLVSLVSYKTAFEYDSLDRLTRLTYPDNDEVTYHYNDRNLLDEIRGGINGLTQNGRVISGLQYWPSAKQATINYGNGVRTTYGHDSRLRLKTLRTVRPASIESPSSTDLVYFNYDFDSANNITAIHDQRPGSTVPVGDPRRNTQIFQYDDLYRLIRAQYSFHLPGESSRKDGELDYRYDRIGNMIAQISTFKHREQGLHQSTVSLMESGGELGRWNRKGRAPFDSPGPHAITSTRNSATQSFIYDANGNMILIEGLTNIWDFKDCLIAAASSNSIARYAYDYRRRRISKEVVFKQNIRDFEYLSTTHYINKYFEVRENDSPTKYIWNGAIRVASAIGSLKASPRIQRLRLYAGWNFSSAAVDGATFPHRPEILAAYKWKTNALTWAAVLRNEVLPAGVVLWVYARTNISLALRGTYSDPTDRIISSRNDFIPSAGLELWGNVSETMDFRAAAKLWAYVTTRRQWFPLVPLIPNDESGIPRIVGPGKGIFISTVGDFKLKAPSPSMRIKYYHLDHLTSLSVVSDANGEPIAEFSHYAFGSPRLLPSTGRHNEPYSFTQHERDIETHFHHFEQRYLLSKVARFICVDPLATKLPNDWISDPQKLNGYAYVQNRPITHFDVDGKESINIVELSPEEFNYVAEAVSQGSVVGLVPAIGIIGSMMNDKATRRAVTFLAERGAIGNRAYVDLLQESGLDHLKGVLTDAAFQGAGAVKNLGKAGEMVAKGLYAIEKGKAIGDAAAKNLQKPFGVVTIGDYAFVGVQALSKTAVAERRENTMVPYGVRRVTGGRTELTDDERSNRAIQKALENYATGVWY